MPNFRLRHGVTARRCARRARRARAQAVALTCAGALAAGGCAAPQAPAVADDRLHVVTTFTVLADMVREVGGEHVRVESVTKVGAEIHGYEPTPGDLARAQGADLVIDNGLHLEAWFARFVADLDAPHVTASSGVVPVAITEGAGAGRPNPHAWMSPRAGRSYAHTIGAALADADPAHADAYAARAAAYAERIGRVGDELDRAVRTLPPGARLLVTCEGAFSYLARDAGLAEAYLWPVNAESQATPRSAVAVVEAVRAAAPRALFCESTVSDVTQRQVADETGLPLAGPLYVDSLSGPDGPVPTYLDLLRHDVDVIVAGLTATEAP